MMRNDDSTLCFTKTEQGCVRVSESANASPANVARPGDGEKVAQSGIKQKEKPYHQRYYLVRLFIPGGLPGKAFAGMISGELRHASPRSPQGPGLCDFITEGSLALWYIFPQYRGGPIMGEGRGGRPPRPAGRTGSPSYILLYQEKRRR